MSKTSIERNITHDKLGKNIYYTHTYTNTREKLISVTH